MRKPEGPTYQWVRPGKPDKALKNGDKCGDCGNYKVLVSVKVLIKIRLPIIKCQMSEQSPAEYPKIEQSMFFEVSVADNHLTVCITSADTTLSEAESGKQTVVLTVIGNRNALLSSIL